MARAQRQAVIGFGGSVASSAAQTAAFRAALGLSGFTEGQTITIEYRWAEGHYDRLPALAADLLKGALDVLFNGVGPVVALATKAATKIVPIVFVTGDDPVRYGLVESFARPGGNFTGVVFFQVALGAKRLELLREMLPAAKAVGYLVNPTNPGAGIEGGGGCSTFLWLGVAYGTSQHRRWYRRGLRQAQGAEGHR